VEEKDLKIKWFYKGIKIRRYHRHILPQMIGMIIIVPLIVSLLINAMESKFIYSSGYVAKGIFYGLAFSVILALLMYRIWFHIYNMQKICQMIFNSMLYNLEGQQRGRKILSKKKHIAYFPSMYYRYKGRKLKISIKLDGSKFHQKFNNLGELLSEQFDMETTSEMRRYWYMVYTLEAIEEDRLRMGRDIIEYIGNAIPLMKGVAWDFVKAPHALITGVTGGGKTYFLYYLIESLLNIGAELKIIDPKRSDLYGLRKTIGEENVAYAPGRVMAMCRELMEEMENRYEALDDTPFGSNYEALGLKPRFLIFDEFIAFIEKLGKSPEAKTLMSYLTRVVLEGRQAGIFVIFATQRADAKYLPGAIRDNLGLRVSLGSLEKSGYRMTFGDVDKDFEKFDKGHGYFWINGTTNTVREFYAPFLGKDYDPAEKLKEIMKGNRHRGPAVCGSRPSGSDPVYGACPSEPPGERGNHAAPLY